MKKTNMKKSLIVLALITIIGGLVLTSLAYFTDADAATNTFTVGKIDIELEEPLFDLLEGEEAKRLIPGKEIDKDPTVTVIAKSEDAYVFMHVDSEINGWLEPLAINENWLAVGTRVNLAGRTQTLYVYKGAGLAAKVVPYATGDTTLEALFETIQVLTTLDNQDFGDYLETDVTILIGAYAHQAEYTDYATAEAAAIAYFWAMP